MGLELRLIDTSAAANWGYMRALGRAFAGAIVFSLPLLMTMEMWWLGFSMPAWKLALFLALFFPFLFFMLFAITSTMNAQVLPGIDALIDA